jgi:hypothetical protein
MCWKAAFAKAVITYAFAAQLIQVKDQSHTGLTIR